jgi:hypothetical protein
MYEFLMGFFELVCALLFISFCVFMGVAVIDEVQRELDRRDLE